MHAFLNEMCQESSKILTKAVEHAAEWADGSAKWDKLSEVR